jgi:hypothetical protein
MILPCFVDSGLLTALEEHAFVDGQPMTMCVYGDPAYPLRIHLQAPYRNRPYITPQMEAFNKSMSTVRVAVEWLFGNIINYLKFLDLKIGLSSIGKMYVVAAILRNALTCMHTNNTSKFFEVVPPAIDEYFA